MTQKVALTIAEKMTKWIGYDLMVESTFPIPTGDRGPGPDGTPGTGFPIVVFAPIKGRLLDVMVDGFELQIEGHPFPKTMTFAQLRSYQPMHGLASATKLPPRTES